MTESFAEMFTAGGKSNSLGKASEVIETVLQNKDYLEELYACVFNDDAWVRMRAIDAVEKIGRQKPEWLVPYIDTFQSELASSKQPSIQWHLAQMYSQFDLNAKQKLGAIAWLKDILSNAEVDWIVSVNAMKSLVQFTKDGSAPYEVTVSLLKLQLAHKSKSVTKKASQLLSELSQ